ncbi:hypothetical protein SAMD00019534_042470 [Acytostelium subglobosum LB1]|uniref:hypothetical protein n=1 Tax=Acytostelium subglobosum LB1 TaxID=1410327 RepID=UPI0006450446|nr:hypothetical protein SAMD00019534_042470 [Acytostelium subglobosum LB1]GAM21072.1 hypothetical protein SAMD00019534_042470 [Acytostelium subglobosum LB1]|eukprot:XP_012756206.1 hypothetical protein SAMD00019534_042470 [Acytostelium subglobosum LB1]
MGPKKAAATRRTKKQKEEIEDVEDNLEKETEEAALADEDREASDADEKEESADTKKRKRTTTTTSTVSTAPISSQDEVDGDEDGAAVQPAASAGDFNADDFSKPEMKDGLIKIISWNVAGFNSCASKGFKAYVEKEQPDILCLQETKIEQTKAVGLKAIPDGYEYHFNTCEKPGQHGTALLTKIKPVSVTKGIGISKHDKEGRVITAEYEKFYVVNSYVPNSGTNRTKPLDRLDYRTKEWDVDFFNYMKNLNKTKPVIWCGDLNVAHKEIDLKNPKTNLRTAGFTIEERTSFSGHLESGFVDTYRHFNPKKEFAYTFWSYMRNSRASNIGWRLDYFIVPATFIGSILHSYMRTNVTGSDHCPIGIIVDATK